MEDHRLVSYSTLSEIDPLKWKQIEDPHSPFADWDFLYALEEAQCVGPGTGWTPLYLTLWKGDVLRAASFLYVKENSYGEYIFDWSWADASMKAGIPYYPKLTSAIPFTPASCHKFLLDPNCTESEKQILRTLLLKEATHIQERFSLSSQHYLFIAEEEKITFSNEGFLIRESFQYHWKNHDYQKFEDFLNDLKSRKTKQIKKERAAVSHLETKIITGSELSAALAFEFYEYYLTTIEDKKAIPYLTLGFFQLIFGRMKDRIILVTATLENKCRAQALFFSKGDNLYGRYWGANTEIPNLHFELCYYQGIDLAISLKKKVFEAGAQGEHKIARGFSPTLTFSAHNFAHSGLKSAVKRFIEEEKGSIKETFQYLNEFLPFKNEN